MKIKQRSQKEPPHNGDVSKKNAVEPVLGSLCLLVSWYHAHRLLWVTTTSTTRNTQVLSYLFTLGPFHNPHPLFAGNLYTAIVYSYYVLTDTACELEHVRQLKFEFSRT